MFSSSLYSCFLLFFFNDTATTEIYPLSLHDALPICPHVGRWAKTRFAPCPPSNMRIDRKSTRLNSSHTIIPYAVFCLKKKTSTRSASATFHTAPYPAQTSTARYLP